MKLLHLLIFTALCSTNCGLAVDENGTPRLPHKRPVTVGYLQLSQTTPLVVPWDKITHLCLAFGYVKKDGSLDSRKVSEQRSLIAEAHAKDVKVLISVGGGGTKDFSEAILNEENRNRLVNNIVRVVNELTLDGVDVDYEEWGGGAGGIGAGDREKRVAVESLYEQLRTELTSGKLITAAVSANIDNGGWGNYKCFGPETHRYLDLVNLMIYDETGPWASSRVANHASWEFFEGAIKQWLEVNKLPKEKLVAGVPFYGIKFASQNSPKGASFLSYHQIISNHPTENVAAQDQVALTFYNGQPTIRAKAEYVKSQNLGGIMIWALSQDSPDADKSLLNTIHSVLGRP